MAVAWDEAQFRRWYSLPNGAGAMTTYSRVGWRYYRGPSPEWAYGSTVAAQFPDHPLNEYRHRVGRIVAQFPILPTSRILVLGCGSGFLPEAFIWWQTQQGQTEASAQGRICGVDNSQFIQGNLVSEAHPLMSGRVVNQSLLDGTGVAKMRNALRNLTGSEFFDFVVTESVIESYTVAERTNFLDKCATYRASATPLRNIIHIACDGWDASAIGGSPAMTLEEWAATRPAHSWISYNGSMPAIIGTG